MTTPENDGPYARAMHALAEITFRLLLENNENPSKGNRDLVLRAYRLAQGTISLIDDVTNRQVLVVKDIIDHAADNNVIALAQMHIDNIDAVRQNLVAASQTLEMAMTGNGYLPTAVGHG